MLSAVPVGDLTEGNAAAWTTFASDSATSSVSDDSSHVKSGLQSLHFQTASGFDTGVRLAAPAALPLLKFSAASCCYCWGYGSYGAA